jgi:hypothetical protein
MLIEWWEKIRGYDKWVQTTAKLDSADLERTTHSDRSGHVSYTYASDDRLTWADCQGEQHTADFRVDDESSLYQLVGGEPVTIHYNPAQPEQFYFRELLRSRTRRFFQLARNWFIGLVVFALFIGFVVVTHGR